MIDPSVAISAISRVGDRPLRLPLRRLHGGRHDFPAEGGGPQPRGARPGLLSAFVRHGRAEAPPHGGEPLSAATSSASSAALGAPSGSGPPRRADPHDERQPARPLRRRAVAAGSGASTSRVDTPTRPSPPRSPGAATWPQVLEGLQAAKRAGLQVKINTVALKGVNDDEFDRLVEWTGEEGFPELAAINQWRDVLLEINGFSPIVIGRRMRAPDPMELVKPY